MTIWLHLFLKTRLSRSLFDPDVLRRYSCCVLYNWALSFSGQAEAQQRRSTVKNWKYWYPCSTRKAGQQVSVDTVLRERLCSQSIHMFREEVCSVVLRVHSTGPQTFLSYPLLYCEASYSDMFKFAWSPALRNVLPSLNPSRDELKRCSEVSLKSSASPNSSPVQILAA